MLAQNYNFDDYSSKGSTVHPVKKYHRNLEGLNQYAQEGALQEQGPAGLFSYKNCYDNCRNSRALIGYFSLSISGQTHEFIIYAMRQRTRADMTICYRKSKVMSVVCASALLLTMDFVITLSK